MADMRPVVPIDREIRKRVVMLESVIEVRGELSRVAYQELLGTFKRVQSELLGETDGVRDTW